MYFVWAGAEIAVAMVCLGIPTLRPLYLKQRGMSIGYSDRAHTHNSDPELPLFTMCEQKPPAPVPPRTSEKVEAESAEVAEGIGEKTGHMELEESATQADARTSSPGPTSFLRDSSSSHTMVESSPSPEPHVQRPESARTRDRSDSVDDILGLYNSDRSRSRGRAKAALYDGRPSTSGAIVVKNEIWVDVERQAGSWPLRT